MHFNRVIVIFTLILTLCIPISICALTEEVVVDEGNNEIIEDRNLFEEFYYRLVLKDTKDFYDYIMLGTFVVGLLIVMVFQNTHYYTVQVKEETKTPVKKQYNKPKYENQNNSEKKNNYHKKKKYYKKKNNVEKTN